MFRAKSVKSLRDASKAGIDTSGEKSHATTGKALGTARRTRGARAAAGLLAAANQAFAGWFVLLPLLVLSVVVAVIVSVVTAVIAARTDPFGPPDPGGGAISVDPRVVDPRRPDPGPDDPRPRPEPARPGSLEMRLDGPVDFRELRYTLRYRAGQPAMPAEVLHLYSVHDPADRVREVPSAQILEQPGRYPRLGEPGVRLCRRGITLSAAEPQCHGVLRLSPTYTDLQSVRTRVLAQASPRPPTGPQALPDGADAVSAEAGLRLVNTFFVMSSGPPDFSNRLSRIEQDLDHPEVFRSEALPMNGPGQPGAGSARRLELARDRSRVYLLTDRALSSLAGAEGGPRVLYRSYPGEVLAGATPTATGVCVAWSRADQSGLRCLRQDHDNWGPEQVFPQPMTTVDMDSAGSSLMVVGTEPGHPDQPRGYYVADASQQWLEFQPAPVARPGVLHVDGVHALRAWSAGRDDYLVRGVFEGQRPGLWQLGMGDAVHDQAPAFFLPDPPPGPDPFPGALPSLRDAEVWPGLAPGMVRVLALAQRPAVIDYSLLHRRPVSASRKDWDLQLGTTRLDTLRVLDGAGRQKWLALSGRRQQQPRSLVALLRWNSPAAEPEQVAILDFSDPAQASLAIRFEVQVREISGNAMVLHPEV